jgi:predicted AlkP superfamily pyrophosphatase or phosphodiesterase
MSRVAFCFVMLVLAMIGDAPVQAKPISEIPAKDRIVVIISVDGLPAFYLNDPKADLPTLRKLTVEGAVAERMKAVLPTLTWPNHTTLVTGVAPGKHGVIGNNYWDRKQEKSIRLITDPIFNKDEIVKAPTIYDVAYAAGLKTAGINWPATRGAKTLHWTTPDIFGQDLYTNYTTPALLEDFRAANIPFEKQEEWCKTDKGRERDVMYTQMLLHVIKQYRPNLILLHLVELDHAEHAVGPRGQHSYEAGHFEDERVKEIIDVLQERFPGRATVFVTSDHGFITVQKKIQANVKLKQEGLLKVDGGKITERRVFAFDQGGSSFIYITDTAQRAELTKRVATIFKGVEGIEQIIPSQDFKRYGLATPQEDPHMPDLVLTAKDGYTFSDAVPNDQVIVPLDKEIGVHGQSPALPDMYATFIAWGAGIKRGAKLKEIDNVDVAPTAAALLGLQMKNVEGRVLRKILQ